MDFSEKLTMLLSLTTIKNSELAIALNLGQPYVSRLKSGKRKMPSNLQTIRNIAEYFAVQCADDYRLGALREYTLDHRLNTYVSKTVLADIIFDWLTGANKSTNAPAEHFLNNIENFSQNNFIPDLKIDDGDLPQASGISIHYRNEGKRQALKNMLAYVDSMNKPCTIYLFTDEIYDWLIEDSEFVRWLNAALNRLVSKGFLFNRIQPPFNSAEFNFSAIERWLVCFMSGSIQQYYYPWVRDKMHRRTIFVIPNHIAMYSNSVYGEHESFVTTLSREPIIVNICYREYECIMRRCRPAMSTFSSDSNRLFTEAENIAAIEEIGIYKTDCLSINTLPQQIIERIAKYGTTYTKRLYESFMRRCESRKVVLMNNVITDIMCLPELDNVLSGKEPIPGTQSISEGQLYYTPLEYQEHLKHILYYLDNFPNYQAIFTKNTVNKNMIIYIKGESHALIIKKKPLLTVFNITEHTMATAFCDYFRNIVEESTSVCTRQATIETIKKELRRLSAALQ